MSNVHQFKRDIEPPKLSRTELPPPRVWDIEQIAAYIGMSKHWIYKCNKKSSPLKPLPRLPRTRLVKVDSQSEAFREWLDWFFEEGVNQ